MSQKDRIFEFSELDFDSPIADQDEIRRHNPQRYEVEQLTGIVFESDARQCCVGYKDVTDHEFWVRGHMPGLPIMPGVIILEAAAQLCSYYVHKFQLMGPSVILGLGGLEEVRFRDPVRPGDRLIVGAELLKMRVGAMCVCRFQAYVGESLVAEGKIKGVALPIGLLSAAASGTVA
ncbi:MAG: 3-hydroxyacyl-ACP dehydratase FabZ family protein [Pirellulales bacterium]